MKRAPYRPSPDFLGFLATVTTVFLLFISIPYLAVGLAEVPAAPAPFPVSVDPRTKTITERPVLSQAGGPLVAAAVGSLRDGSAYLAAAIMSTKVHEYLALPEPVAVRIPSGMRKEQVATLFASELAWSKDQKDIFLKEVGDVEGMLYPSVYLVPPSTTPAEAAHIITARFDERVRARYASSTEAQVPMSDALALASIIEREAGDESEMPIIAGILWNRLFSDMRLQADSTLSYARGTARNGWWPVPRSRDKYIKSPFNTYQNEGLPPAPIASPSVAAVYAALNPAKTDCLFFFHAKNTFYCSATYEEHVKKLRKIYGRGK